MMIAPTPIELIGTALFALAVAHTFMASTFQRLARRQPAHAGAWHLLGEVETVFGVWALILVLFMLAIQGSGPMTRYLGGLSYTEPMFVFVIMVIAASRPILVLAQRLVVLLARALPMPNGAAFFFVVLSFTPLLGSFITEPAAMTLTALLLRDQVFKHPISSRLKYAALGVLFVNVSIGGTLTPYAAPPVLIVARTWGWDLADMLSLFGWRAALAVLVNAAVVTAIFWRPLKQLPALSPETRIAVPPLLTLVHVLFLVAVVVFAHHPPVFIGLLLFFMGLTHAYPRHQDPLLLREGLMVAFFLAGLVTLGAQQSWWLSQVLKGLDPTVLYYGATALTAITDNAALTFLGSLVPDTSDAFKVALVAGAVTGGGLTVIANAPNPAGWSILREHFPDGAISPLGLFVAAVPPTLVAIVAFRWL